VADGHARIDGSSAAGSQFDHDVFRARDIFGGAENDHHMIEVIFDGIGEQQLAEVEVGVAYAGIVVELKIEGAPRSEGALGGGKLPWKSRGKELELLSPRLAVGAGWPGFAATEVVGASGAGAGAAVGVGYRRNHDIRCDAGQTDVADETFVDAYLGPFSTQAGDLHLVAFSMVVSTPEIEFGLQIDRGAGADIEALPISLFST